MFLLRRSRLLLRRQVQAPRALGRVAVARAGGGGGVVRGAAAARRFSQSARLCAVKPVLLADIGEGIVECEVIQWFVEPGARVEEFSPLCEVQSDKASVEITSRFAGTVKKLYYEAGEMARVGKPFVDIDIEGPAPAAEAEEPARQDEAKTVPMPTEQTAGQALSPMPGPAEGTAKAKGKMAGLATPAVRHLSKELKVDIGDVDGTGRDGRVLKEDIHKFVQAREAGQTAGPPAAGQGEYRVPLGATQQHMFKTMTRSLAIPHFLYADEIDFTGLTELRARLNRVLAAQSAGPGPEGQGPEPAAAPGPEAAAEAGAVQKLSYLPFIIKAVSLALYRFPLLNARVEAEGGPGGRPALVMRPQHHVGVAMDTAQGLLVPVVHDVGALSVTGVAAELGRLQRRAREGRLTPADLAGGTITVSNIGSIGGTYLSPVVVEREVAILGVGRMRTVPAFGPDGALVRRRVCNFSWSADHRVVDGATMARAAEVVRRLVEEPDTMLMHLR